MKLVGIVGLVVGGGGLVRNGKERNITFGELTPLSN